MLEPGNDLSGDMIELSLVYSILTTAIAWSVEMTDILKYHRS